MHTLKRGHRLFLFVSGLVEQVGDYDDEDADDVGCSGAKQGDDDTVAQVKMAGASAQEQQETDEEHVVANELEDEVGKFFALLAVLGVA